MMQSQEHNAMEVVRFLVIEEIGINFGRATFNGVWGRIDAKLGVVCKPQGVREVMARLKEQGFIIDREPPSEEKDQFVKAWWDLTQKGRDYLENAKLIKTI